MLLTTQFIIIHCKDQVPFVSMIEVASFEPQKITERTKWRQYLLPAMQFILRTNNESDQYQTLGSVFWYVAFNNEQQWEVQDLSSHVILIRISIVAYFPKVGLYDLHAVGINF
jgi:hypothetical protein